MASKNDYIAKAVNSVIEEDKVIDLLLISDYLDDINDEDIGKVRDYGMHYSYLYIGMSGQKMVDKMNENFEATDAEFLAHNKAINLRIISEDIKYIKEENGVLKYSKDGETWNSLISSWGKITGDITQQTDLQLALQGKASQLDFNNLSNTINLMGNTITIMGSSITSLSDQVASIVNSISGANGILTRLDNLETSNRSKISSENVIDIRQSNGALEYTTDGSTWIPVSSVGTVTWGDITGDITNQPDLIAKLNEIKDIADGAARDVSTLSTNLPTLISNEVSPVSIALTNHVTDQSNPHNVTKEQLGIHVVSKAEYDALIIDNSHIYFVDDTFYNAYEYILTFDFNGGSWNLNETYDYYHGKDTTILLSDVITSTPTYENHTFLGFNTAADAATADYVLSDNYAIPNSADTLYAIWS